MEAELASEYDVIVVGTGFVESIVAAAAARIGKKVLHIDNNDYYGGQWASFTLQGIHQWVENVTAASPPVPSIGGVTLEDGEKLVAVGDPNRAYTNVKQTWHILEEVATPNASEEGAVGGQDSTNTTTTAEAKATDNTAATEETTADPGVKTEGAETKDAAAKPDAPKEAKVWSQKELLKLSRKFNLDLAPKLLYSRGPLVELLISSNVARYTEFKCITRVLTWVEENGEGDEKGSTGGLVAVPCSRSDVFTTNAISLVEKRLLMKFLEFCNEYEKHPDQFAEYETKTFREFLASRRLTENLIHFVTEAMAMVGPDETCRVGLERTRLFLTSLGRYGSTPFLFSMYGCGELPQAFCRLCAVFEGTYVLRKPLSHLILDSNNKCVGVVAEGQRFKCGNVVLSVGQAPAQYIGQGASPDSLPRLSRAIIVTDKSIMPQEKEQLTLLRMPSAPDISRPITVVEVGQGGGVCPQDSHCVQLTCEGHDAEADLAGAVTRLIGPPHPPAPLWSLYFNQVDLSGCDLVTHCPVGLHLCPGPDATLDYDGAITQAQNVFKQMFPDDTFLPRAPDPEEIVFDNAGAEPAEGDQLGQEESEKEKDDKDEGKGEKADAEKAGCNPEAAS